MRTRHFCHERDSQPNRKSRPAGVEKKERRTKGKRANDDSRQCSRPSFYLNFPAFSPQHPTSRIGGSARRATGTTGRRRRERAPNTKPREQRRRRRGRRPRRDVRANDCGRAEESSGACVLPCIIVECRIAAAVTATAGRRRRTAAAAAAAAGNGTHLSASVVFRPRRTRPPPSPFAYLFLSFSHSLRDLSLSLSRPRLLYSRRADGTPPVPSSAGLLRDRRCARREREEASGEGEERSEGEPVSMRTGRGSDRRSSSSSSLRLRVTEAIASKRISAKKDKSEPPSLPPAPL